MWRALFEKLFLLKIWQCQKVQLPITEVYATAGFFFFVVYQKTVCY